MSIMWTLRRWIDPEQRKEEQDRRRHREAPRPDEQGGDDDPPRVDPPARHATFACRVCGQEGPDPRFCARCLAETMRPID